MRRNLSRHAYLSADTLGWVATAVSFVVAVILGLGHPAAQLARGNRLDYDCILRCVAIRTLEMDCMGLLDSLGYIFRSTCFRDVGNLRAAHTALDSGHIVGDSTRFCRGDIDPGSHR